MFFGHRIASLREKNNLTQEELAHILGISRSALSHYEQNRREPDYEKMNKIADLFKVTVDYLLMRTDNPRPYQEHFTQKPAFMIELSSDEQAASISLQIDGLPLTKEERKRFVAFVRTERNMR